MTLEALIFDVDGTLADTERDGHRVAFNAAFQEFSLNWQWDVDLYGQLLKVTGGKERIRHYVAAFNRDYVPPPDFDELVVALHQAKNQHYARLVSSGGLPLRPGIRRLLQEAKHAGMRLAIATTTTPVNVSALLSAAQLDGDGGFEVIGAGDVVPQKKPAADIYTWVLHKMGLSAAQCLALEDSENGLISSLAAGIKTLITISDYTQSHNFSGAVAVLSDLGEPDQPMRVLQGEALGKTYVDVDLLCYWHSVQSK